MRRHRVTTLLLLASVFICPLLLHAQQPHVFYVNRTDSTCGGHSPCFGSIQTAINAAQPRSTIRIQAGVYQEQLEIEKNTFGGAVEADRIIIESDPSAQPGQVVLRGMPGAGCYDKFVVRFHTSKFITVRDLTITAAAGPAFHLLGGSDSNTGIHIELNRIFGNGSPSCTGGIVVNRGNPGTIIANNIIYANGRDGILFQDADGGPHYIINNTLFANGWNGVEVARQHQVTLANNIINSNGTAGGSTGGRFGIQRENSTNPQPQGIKLLNNLICGNTGGQINGPVLDATDSGNFTPLGNEGAGVSALSSCANPANIFTNRNGPDGLPNTIDDDFSLKQGSLAIDIGVDPRTLGLDPAFNSVFEADFQHDGVRPADGNADRVAAFDASAFEYPNAPPLANAGADRTVNRGQPVTLNGSQSNDPEGAPLTYQWSIASQPPGSNITLTGAITASPTFMPLVAGNYGFRLVVSDGQYTSVPAQVRITAVNPNSQAPTANNLATTSHGDSPFTIILSASDADSTSLTFGVVAAPGHGTLGSLATPNCGVSGTGSICTTTVTYTPGANYNGADSFTFKANDGSLDSNIATASITVTALNDAPSANSVTATTNEDTSIAVTLTASDLDNSGLTFSVVSAPAKGTLGTLSNPNCSPYGSGTACTATITYTPSLNANGPDSFTFRANDGALDSNVATVSITVGAINDAPVAENQSVTINEDTPVAIALKATDVDNGNLTLAIVTPPTQGGLGTIGAPNCVASGTGSICTARVTYTPNANFNGADNFKFEANDGSLDSNTATVSIVINTVNDVPVATDDNYMTEEDQSISVFAPGVLGNDNDIDTPLAALTAILVSGPSHAASFALNSDGSFSYTPTGNHNGTDSFTYKVNDGASDSNVATVTIAINPVNDAPVAVNDAYNTDEDAPLNVPARGVLANDNDIDTLPANITAILVIGPSHSANFTLNPDGSFAYTPAANFYGADSFTYKANDGSKDSNVAMVTIAVLSINDAPVAENDDFTVAEHSVLAPAAPGVLENDGDPDVGQTLTVELVSGPTHATAFQLNADGSFIYTPLESFYGVDTFTYRVFDGALYSNMAMAQITVTNVNDPPVAQSQSTTTGENTPKIITLTAADIDSISLTFTIVNAPGHGTLTANKGVMACAALGQGSTCTANVSYLPASNYSGPDSFTFAVSDGFLTSNVATASITVIHTNRPPVLSPIGNRTVNVGNTLSFIVSASDLDNDPLIYSVTPLPLPANASFDVNTRVFAFTPTASQVGSFSLAFAVNDGNGGTASETVTITVQTGLAINITSPVNGATVPSGRLIVRGTVNAITDVGVNVNGFSASVNGDQWVVEMPVNPGSQTLTATASVIAGLQATQSVTVNVTATSGGDLFLSAAPTSGVAPLTVSWLLVNQTGRNLVQFEFDPNGTRAFGAPTSSFATAETIYTAPGLYYPAVRALDDQGLIYTATAVVDVQDPLVVTARFQGLWTSFKDRLQAGDARGALNHLAPVLQSRFQTVFQQLGADLPAIAAGFENLEVLEQLEDIAETAIVQLENNTPKLYFIYFRRDSLGRWLIEEM